VASGPVPISAAGAVSVVCRLAVTNPTTLPLDVTLVAQGDPTWAVAPDHRHAQVPPEEGRVFEFGLVRDDSGTLEGFAAPEFELRFDVLTREARLAMPARSVQPRMRLVAPAGGWPAAATNGVAVLDGKAACLEIAQEDVPVLDGAFTVEAWVKPADRKDGALVGNLKAGGFSLEIAGAPQFRVPPPSSPARGKAPPAVTAKAGSALATGVWSHLAGVYDGSQIVLYVNGRRAAAAPATGVRLASDKSLYVGARPNPAANLFNLSQPVAFWNGSVDDVRVSRGARYRRDFRPETRLAPDRETLLALAHDRALGPFVPLSSAAPFQAWRRGEVIIQPEPR
jgi:hypothetical protein